MTKEQKLSLVTAIIVSMNAMIGSGIFTAPAVIASHAGPAGLLTYLLVIFGTCTIALSLARVAAYVNSAGSFYAYTYPWGGHSVALFASGLYICGLTVAMGLLAKFAGIYLFTLFPQISAVNWGIITIICVTLLNVFGMNISAFGQHLLIAATLLPLFATTILCLTQADFALFTPFAPFGITKVFTSARIIIFSFFGFECCASLYTVMQNPTRDVPRALVLSILFVGIIYFLFMLSLILAIPLHYFADPLTPISSVLKQIFPEQGWLMLTIHTSILAATLGTIHAMQWGTAELLHVLVKKIAFLRPIVPFMNTQCSAIFLGGLLFLPLLFFQNLNLFFSFTAIGVAGAYLFAIITLFFVKKEWRLTRLIVPIIAVATISAILGFSIENIIQELQ